MRHMSLPVPRDAETMKVAMGLAGIAVFSADGLYRLSALASPPIAGAGRGGTRAPTVGYS